MTNDDLTNILKGASAVPPCPTEKFVDSFVGYVEASKAIAPRRDFGWALGGIGSVAAALLLVGGVVLWNGPLFSQPKIVANHSAVAGASTATGDTGNYQYVAYTGTSTDAADQFASQLVGYEDISTVVPMNGM